MFACSPFGNQRPTAKELLQHRFIKTARRTSILTDLIERYQLYRSKSAARGAQSLPTVADLDASLDGTVMSDWSFGTASIAGGGYGTVRGVGAVVLEEDLESGDDEDDEYGFDGRGLSEVGLQGSTVRGPVRLFISRSPIAPSRSPIYICSLRNSGSDDQEPLSLASFTHPVVERLTDRPRGRTGHASRARPQLFGDRGTQGPPGQPGERDSADRERRWLWVSVLLGFFYPSPSGIVRALWKTDAVLVATLGRITTVRPQKHVDLEGTRNMSDTFVGSIRDVPLHSKMRLLSVNEEKLSSTALAGRAMIDEVIMPTIQRVRLFSSS